MAHSTGASKGLTSPGGMREKASLKIPSIVRIAQRLGRMIPEEELRLIPKDLSGQTDHYIYGTPKQ